ncbi:MAG: single-stranded-DNA-specific exonuclease RecJ [Beijerinckiaceae bacterium]
MTPAFLSVTRSLTGRRWADRLDAAGQREALAIAQAHGLGETLARVLAGRGVTVASAPGFLDPKLRDLMPDPSTLRDMDLAVERLAVAVRKREHVAIFGDYDVDGATSAALLALYLRAYGAKVSIHIPDRIREGYGPNTDAIMALRAGGATLLVTVDCGVSSHGPLSDAQGIGLDTVVLDHHLAPETLPPAVAVVNPNRQDDVSGLGNLAACGVVFMTLVALQRRLRGEGVVPTGDQPDLMAMLDIVALGTVADVVPLTGLNRALVRQGLKVMRQRHRPGLAALMDASGLKEPPEAWHLGFLLGPRINAGGRIGDAALGSRLLTLDDPAEAARIAQELDRLNRERQAIEQITVERAIAETEAAEAVSGAQPVIVAGGEDWHAGVVGLVASRLKERFQRPALAIAWDAEAGQGVGSARSVPGADIGQAVRRAAEQGLIVKGGGHAMAAGLTLTRDQLEPLRTFLADALSDDVAAASADNAIMVDAALTAGSLTSELAGEIARAGPFGQGNAEPLVALPAHEIMDVTPAGAAHLRLRFRAGDGSTGQGIAFRAQGQPLGDALLRLKGRRVHLLGSLQVDRWGGRERVDLRLADAAEAR